MKVGHIISIVLISILIGIASNLSFTYLTTERLSNDEKTFIKLLEDDWENTLQENPFFASLLGDERFNDQVTCALKQLGISSLEAILLHYPKDILENKNFELIHFLSNLKKDGVIKKIGVSIYEKNELEEILKIFKPEIIQCPINLFDNRLLEKNYLEEISNKGIEVHIRSIFLQGLLLFKKEEMPQEFLKFQNIWQEWYNWLKIIKLNPLEACIRYTNSIKGVDKIVVGINSANQLKQIIKYMRKPKLYKGPNWQNPISTELIDPRLWK